MCADLPSLEQNYRCPGHGYTCHMGLSHPSLYFQECLGGGCAAEVAAALWAARCHGLLGPVPEGVLEVGMRRVRRQGACLRTRGRLMR